MNKLLSLIVLLVLLTSCASKENILYYQNIENATFNGKQYNPVIKSDDELLIVVSASNPEAALPFNLTTISVPSNEGNLNVAAGQNRIQTYLVDKSGNINFPQLGVIKMGGLTRTEAVDLLISKLNNYITNPMVNLRITNFKVTVQGEVAQPGVFKIDSERITLPEAISRAGDLTIYGNRRNVLVIREIDGVKTHKTIDLTKTDFINSDYYYLTQNDLVVVEPNKTKVNSSAVGANTSVILSTVSLLLTIVALILK